MSDETVSPEVVENRRRWVEALESGEYKQHRRALYAGNDSDDPNCARCCLGVGTYVLGVRLWGGGLTGAVGSTRKLSGVLVAANDDDLLTFPEIAALLRSDAWFGPDLDRRVR